MRDHHEVAHDAIVKFGARPMNDDAARALEDPEYRARMIEYGRQLASQLDPVWEREVLAHERVKAQLAPLPGGCAGAARSRRSGAGP